jgi:hypothetical protein
VYFGPLPFFRLIGPFHSYGHSFLRKA